MEKKEIYLRLIDNLDNEIKDDENYIIIIDKKEIDLKQEVLVFNKFKFYCKKIFIKEIKIIEEIKEN